MTRMSVDILGYLRKKGQGTMTRMPIDILGYFTRLDTFLDTHVF
jgi:hypothetical protein